MTETGLSAAASRYDRKRDQIIAAATELINELGYKGMTLTKVAQAIDLNTTSITYYFKRKELLAEAILEAAIERYNRIVDQAELEPTPFDKLHRMVWATLEQFAQIRSGDAPPVANLSHIRSLNEPLRTRLSDQYIVMFRRVRRFFEEEDGSRKHLATAQTHVLLENLFWAQAWLRRYSLGDFERVAHRFSEVLAYGVSGAGRDWDPALLTLEEPETVKGLGDMNIAFLKAAAITINDWGYRGASVDRIAAELSVTKGSFYHHLQSKDDLVLACFDLSYARVSLAQRAAERIEGDHHRKLCASVASLLALQFYGDSPLLRTTALYALPPDVRAGVIERSNRMARRYAGVLIDGITESSIKAIDPLIAAQMIMATLNTAYEMRRWAEVQSPEQAIKTYASIITRGLIPNR
ncbi:MAG: TetR family transcriptional regulator [Oceanicaulis sp.]|jgi:AcrR family transcriptional regulator|uniref:TetR/AcrR family transcriptional regulator n=1 Tax=unclassified Oceanicaulis TaxID=2632123 RepID=UPI000C4A6BB6|nr:MULTISPECIES: TetR/AcrR family transcriptional regulator [unclassified Oceanicaulis]MAB69274.1 TetR family transcriptional regulator [Oceanicaulis sp.]MBC40211.1 TetR family transcriptional regulator [Oceanicaulis sp.]MBG34368.1 TetR family transcriptional regulator [Oceanicaulis sp.]HBU62819.1 TetR/AcrR family transcriptional regulator [Oceanicaulis sp.]HCR94827.1 TetR/AcrR family transcriptional regulator [Oceanicaulis sp.]|tara:strand:+ start:338 stop:1564 length:1227 start_codon:yes stop_codon:yes gene_type:complete